MFSATTVLHVLTSHPWLSVSTLLVLPVLYHHILLAIDRHAVNKLGASAPRVRSSFPFGLEVVIRSVFHTVIHRDLEFWFWLFSWSPNPHTQTTTFELGRQRFVFTADPENIKAVLATQFQDYGKGQRFHDEWKDFLGDSIFTTDGQLWHNNRQLIRPQFIKTRVADLEIFEKHTQILLRHIGGHGKQVDISALFYRFTLDTATDFLLGRSVDSMNDPQTKFAKAFGDVQRLQNAVSRAGPFQKFLPRKSFWAGLKVIEEFVQPFIDRALLVDLAALQEKKDQSFLDALAATGTRDRKAIRDQIVAILLAGRDTTASTLSFAFQELSNHPEMVAKLRREISERVGMDRSPTYEDLKNMKYLQNVINETLRLYPAVPFNIRMALRDTTLPTGGGKDGLEPIGILKDTAIGYAVLAMQRREDLFPSPSADFAPIGTFSPERWEKWQPKPWTFLPFNGGPRICIGQQFALTEIGYTIVRILQRFERVERHWTDEDAIMKAEIVLSPAKGVKVGFWEATND